MCQKFKTSNCEYTGSDIWAGSSAWGYYNVVPRASLESAAGVTFTMFAGDSDCRPETTNPGYRIGDVTLRILGAAQGYR